MLLEHAVRENCPLEAVFLHSSYTRHMKLSGVLDYVWQSCKTIFVCLHHVILCCEPIRGKTAGGDNSCFVPITFESLTSSRRA